MKKQMLPKTACGIALAALAGFAPLAGAQTSATTGSPADDSTMPSDSGAVVNGTIPAAPPGLPELAPSGAQGPVRPDTGLASDPSIRDTDPDTQNGLWEQLPGNRVVSSNSEVRQRQQQQEQQ